MTDIDFRPYLSAALACGNCDWHGTEDGAEAITDFALRVAPGEIVPAGQCPKCRALCYLDADDPDAETDPEKVLHDAAIPMLRALEGVAHQLKEPLNGLVGEPWARRVIEAIDLANGRKTDS